MAGNPRLDTYTEPDDLPDSSAARARFYSEKAAFPPFGATLPQIDYWLRQAQVYATLTKAEMMERLAFPVHVMPGLPT